MFARKDIQAEILRRTMTAVLLKKKCEERVYRCTERKGDKVRASEPLPSISLRRAQILYLLR